MKILLTGATGYLGSYLLKNLLHAGHELVVLKRLTSNTDRIKQYLSQCQVIEIDPMVDLSIILSVIRTCDMVLHAATSYGRHQETDMAILKSNLLFPLTLLEWACQQQVPYFVNLDSALPQYTNAYSLSKKQLIQWGHYYEMQHKIQCVNLELQHFFGPGDDESKFITYVIRQCLRQQPLLLTLGEQQRDFLYIDDMVAAILSVIEHINALGETRHFELGSGQAVTVRHMVETIHRLSVSHAELRFGAKAYRWGEPMFCQANSRTLTMLGWKPKWTLEQALKDTIEQERKICVI